MALVPQVGRKAWSIRSFIVFVYVSLIVMGATMVVPFLITISNSATNDYDYQRFRIVPRYIWSVKDRFMKGLVYFFNGFQGWNDQMRAYVPEMPSYWTSWATIGGDIKNCDALAATYVTASPETWARRKIIAADYSVFCDRYPLDDTTVTVINPQAVDFTRAFYMERLQAEFPKEFKAMSRKQRQEAAMRLLSEAWDMPYDSFYNVNYNAELFARMDFQGWFMPVASEKFKTFLVLKDCYRAHVYTPGVRDRWLALLKEKGHAYRRVGEVFPVMETSPKELRDLWQAFKAEVAPASPCVPYALREAWRRFLRGEQVAETLKLPAGQEFDIDTYNRIAGTRYKTMAETPFPVPKNAPPTLQKLWEIYVTDRYPLRLTTIRVDADMEKRFQEKLRTELKNLRVVNELLGANYAGWNQFRLTPTAPTGMSDIDKNRRGVWKNFVKTLPLKDRSLSSSEIAYQKFLLEKYGSLENINKTYGWNLTCVEEAFPPFLTAYAVTFLNNQTAMTWHPIFGNYKVVFDYLFLNSSAIWVTILLIALTIFFTLTINPVAAYSLSRFNLRGQDKVILFMLATMAFPAMVSAIPAYLLMRDLGLLNTFAALVLPGAANGMAIFLLKGFFDSLPQELFEAATIDGASEFQIFRIVAMPMVKPILAINCLTAFIAAYNGWEWALIICQKQEMWTLAVWLYQASCWWAGMPWIVSAGFIIASIPTLIAFVSCQKMILKGIVIPSMK